MVYLVRTNTLKEFHVKAETQEKAKEKVRDMIPNNSFEYIQVVTAITANEKEFFNLKNPY